MKKTSLLGTCLASGLLCLTCSASTTTQPAPAWPTDSDGRICVIREGLGLLRNEVAKTKNHAFRVERARLGRAAGSRFADITGRPDRDELITKMEAWGAAQASGPSPSPNPIVQKTARDLINTITRADATKDEQIDFMNAILQKFEAAEEGSIAKRVYDDVAKKKGKREATYMPKKEVNLSVWSEAINAVCSSTHHEQDEEAFIPNMVKKFEEFKIKSKGCGCTIV